jgi:hypothetical protein
MHLKQWWASRLPTLNADDGTVAAGSGESTADDVADGTEAQHDATPVSPAVDLGQVRDLVLAAHPDVVPEMVAGDSFEAIMASVEPAKAAFARIAETFKSAAPPAVGGQTGGTRREYIINVEELSPSAKIAEGLKRYR